MPHLHTYLPTGVHPGNPIEKTPQAAEVTDSPPPSTPGASPALIQRFWEIDPPGAPEPGEDLSHDPCTAQPLTRAVSAAGSPTRGGIQALAVSEGGKGVWGYKLTPYLAGLHNVENRYPPLKNIPFSRVCPEFIVLEHALDFEMFHADRFR